MKKSDAKPGPPVFGVQQAAMKRVIKYRIVLVHGQSELRSERRILAILPSLAKSRAR
jgi:hypothetical protein